MSELVSIIIPVYNAKPFIESCLNSVANQDYQFLEVIIINDGSTDGSEDLIKEYIKNDTRFKLFSQENHGLGYTRNRGISLSNGKYIFFLDSDDIIPRNSIRSLVTAVEKNNADYAVGKVIRFNTERKYIPIRHLEFNLYNKNISTTVLKNPEMMQDSIACNKLWKRDFLVDNNLFFQEDRYYEDLTLTMKAAVIANEIEVITEVVYHWRVRENENKPSITQQQMKLKNTLDRLDALSYNRQWLITSGREKRLIEENDLKSLLDVLRLHVNKYSLIKKEEMEEWKESVISFLKQIPLNIVGKLPEKEKELYKLLMNRNYLDLMLFSQMLTNTEKNPIVIQRKKSFVLKAKDNTYEVTHYLKPTMVVRKVEQLNSEWKLSGDLIIPKASYKTDGKIFIISRKEKDVIYSGNVNLNPVTENSCYPYEKLLFQVNLDTKVFLKYKNDYIFDFYFHLEEYPSYGSARVRLGSNTKSKFNIKNRNRAISLYRTNFGNLSIRIQKYHAVKLFLKKCLSFIKK
ncbi:glycosyltransferase family 2 protein [Sporosarcina sp. Marseille-Q4063]|uniref:glycosyltransferase family 2 protein n=1 Tax=Sporosarcina sp. Marseille-Q4063 TaxID=2810514 RepID=UPI001BAF259D|nr:glycosyltransferase family 2 protein [Sporosarcina sp. Marseille-Q4063]QUW21220.1 glycosyltransferase family 2 protein [Sporosarcina sp. Marseille-Q4063]